MTVGTVDCLWEILGAYRAPLQRTFAQLEADGAVVRAGDVWVDFRGFQAGAQRCGAEEVIDPPANVARAGGAHLAPPRVVAASFFKLAEGVDKATAHEGIEAGALLG